MGGLSWLQFHRHVQLSYKQLLQLCCNCTWLQLHQHYCHGDMCCNCVAIELRCHCDCVAHYNEPICNCIDSVCTESGLQFLFLCVPVVALLFKSYWLLFELTHSRKPPEGACFTVFRSRRHVLHMQCTKSEHVWANQILLKKRKKELAALVWFWPVAWPTWWKPRDRGNPWGLLMQSSWMEM